jgi:dTDP-4-dehydrorhamnose 3,5-epimerase
MKITESKFEGLFILEPLIFKDERGHFTEAYNYEVLRKAGIDIQFVQDNQSFSKAGVIRGLHFQNAPKAQTKLVRVLQGSIWDVVVDLRPDKPTFKMIAGVELSRENGKQLLVPRGFAHGFSVLSEFAEVLYKCDEFYSPEHERGINIADPKLEIDWKIQPKERIVSDKDKSLPDLEDAKFNFGPTSGYKR